MLVKNSVGSAVGFDRLPSLKGLVASSTSVQVKSNSNMSAITDKVAGVISGTVNKALDGVDLSGIKLPKAKAEVGFSFTTVAIIGVVLLLIFKRR